MAYTGTTYGDITPRTAAYAVADFLKRGIPYLVLEQFAQHTIVPNNKTKVVKFRRYKALALATTALTEGVTPSGSTLDSTDVTATLDQYGDFIGLTDVIQDTHEDPVFMQARDVLAEQMAQTLETVRYGVYKAGTNVQYPSGVNARNGVNGTISLAMQRKITRTLKRQNARYITKKLSSSPSYGTQQVAAAFVAVTHPDMESDIRNMAGFVPIEKYATMTPWENEIGKVEDVRYLRSTIFSPFEDAGAAVGTDGLISTSGTDNDVYPILYFAKDAIATIPLRGMNAMTPTVINPKPVESDPLGQRGYVSWKAMMTAAILNDAWMVRAEVGATENPS